MNTLEVCCMVFGHKWWYAGVFTRMCHRCEVVQVCDPDEAKWKHYRFGDKITVPKWRTL